MSPPLAFRCALEVLLIKSYAACRDNIKRTLSTLLASCVQAPGGLPHELQVCVQGGSPAVLAKRAQS